MGQDSIDKVLQARRPAETAPAEAPASEGDKFFSILGGEGLHEFFLELRFRSGMKSCFSYEDLQWFNYDPEGGTIDLEFGGFLITLKGRGLGDEFFQAIKRKRLAWVMEADTEMQDNRANNVFIETILITPPDHSNKEEELAN